MPSKTKKKYTNSKNKISVDIDFMGNDKGYKDLLNPRLIAFLFNNISIGNNLVQTQKKKSFYVNKKNKVYLQAVPIKKWELQPDWSKVECKHYNDFMKVSPCKIGSRAKVFVKLKSTPYIGGFGVYLMGLHIGAIGKEQHIEFITALQKTFGENPVMIDNEDMDWFHLKQFL
jgi:hypothetical protein